MFWAPQLSRIQSLAFSHSYHNNCDAGRGGVDGNDEGSVLTRGQDSKWIRRSGFLRMKLNHDHVYSTAHNRTSVPFSKCILFKYHLSVVAFKPTDINHSIGNFNKARISYNTSRASFRIYKFQWEVCFEIFISNIWNQNLPLARTPLPLFRTIREGLLHHDLENKIGLELMGAFWPEVWPFSASFAHFHNRWSWARNICRCLHPNGKIEEHIK